MTDPPADVVRCPSCAGTNGNHGYVHVRHGNGGGHNEPCPRSRPSHDPRCYQRTGVPADLPQTLCDCRVLRTIDQHNMPAQEASDD